MTTDTIETAHDVYACIGFAADYVRTPGRGTRITECVAGLAVDAVVIFADTLESGQTIERTLAKLLDGSDEANAARENLTHILNTVQLDRSAAADRIREVLEIAQ